VLVRLTLLRSRGAQLISNPSALTRCTLTDPTLESRNLTLVPYSPEQLLALIESPERFEQMAGYRAAEGLRGFLVSDEVNPHFLLALRAANGPDVWRHGFAVIHRATRCVIGNGAFKGPPDQTGVVEIAYGIVPSFEGRGYATEVAGALVDFAFRSPEVQVVRAHTLPTENASTRVLAKCGFTHVGDFHDPEDGPVWRWELTRSSWSEKA